MSENGNEFQSDGNGDDLSVVALASPPEEIPLRPGLAPRQSSALTESLKDFPPPARVRAIAETGPRLLPPLGMIESEPFWKRAIFLILAAALLVGYSYVLQSYFAPAQAGINQNGYLVGGKMLAEHGTMGFKAPNGYVFLGWMWNLVEQPGANGQKEIWFYPKYPIGGSALFAAALKLSEWTTKAHNWEPGKVWVFYVNPICAVLALAATFMLLRQFCGSFIAVLGMLILGCCQVFLTYAEQPLSHAPAMCAVTWGVYMLLRWWQTASIWRGILAGFFLGYAVTIRYTEGLLLLPLAIATLSMIRYDTRNTRWWSMGLLIALAAIGFSLQSVTTHPLERWVAVALTLVAIAHGAFPPIFERRIVQSLNDQHDDSRGARVFGYIVHAVRAIIAAGLVYAVIFVHPHGGDGTDKVGRIVETIFLKIGLAGAIAMLYLIPWSQPRRWLKLIVPSLAWLVPVGVLVGYNWFAMHSLTGYDSTNESTAFTWRMFTDKWDDTVQQIYDYSMFLIPPLALVGSFLMFRWNRRAALLIVLWLAPGMVLYTSYYFGKQNPGMWYLRFFLTLFPAMVIAAMWLLRVATDGVRAQSNSSRGSIAIPLGLGVFAFCSCAIGLEITLPSLAREQAGNLNLFYTCQEIVRHVPVTIINGKKVPAIMFAEGRGNMNAPLDNFLQFSGDFELYPSDGFAPTGGDGWASNDPTMPAPLQHAREQWLKDFYRSKTEAEIIKDQHKIMNDALDEGRQIFAALQPGSSSYFKNHFVSPDFEMKLVAQWREPAKVMMERSMGPLDPANRTMSLSWSRGAQSWQLYRIERKPKPAPVPAPSLSPVTLPATKPAAAGIAAPLKVIPSPTTKPAAPTTAPATAPTTKPK